MAHWKDAAVTNEGVEMLNEWMAGRKICIVAAFGGTGTVDKELLTEQTGLVDARQELYLLGEEDSTDGKTVQVQVQNATVMEEYELNQVGVYAALDVKKDEDAPEEIRAKIKHYINSETGAEFECVEVNESGYIWNPVEDGKSVRDLLGALGNAETTLADVDARLGLLELMYRTQVNGNPFTVSFSDMSGLVVTGVWNETLKRVEF